MPKIKIKQGKQDLTFIIKDLYLCGKEKLARELLNLVSNNGGDNEIMSFKKDFGILQIKKSKNIN